MKPTAAIIAITFRSGWAPWDQLWSVMAWEASDGLRIYDKAHIGTFAIWQVVIEVVHLIGHGKASPAFVRGRAS